MGFWPCGATRYSCRGLGWVIVRGPWSGAPVPFVMGWSQAQWIELVAAACPERETLKGLQDLYVHFPPSSALCKCLCFSNNGSMVCLGGEHCLVPPRLESPDHERVLWRTQRN